MIEKDMAKPIIICVDDEKIVLDSLRKELNTAFSDKLKVEVAESGEEALDLINELVEDNIEIPIIISDWLMPEMKGDEFLIKVQSFLPDTKKIMLTGQATTEGVGNAVNNAKLYRYIAKPWESNDLDLTVTEALKSYYREKQVIIQQKELKELNKNLEKKVQQRTKECELQREEVQRILDNTLKGSIFLLLDIFSRSNPVIFNKAIRLKELTKKIISQLGFTPYWEFEIASLLSQIGCLDIDSNICTKYFNGEPLTQNELVAFKLHPLKTYKLLNKIPHFENVAIGIRDMFASENITEGKIYSLSQPNKISKILIVANDFDYLIISGKSKFEAIDIMKKNKNLYDSDIILALCKFIYINKDDSSDFQSVAIPVSEVKVGMKVSKDIVSTDGNTILKSGEEISQDILISLVYKKKRQRSLILFMFINKIYIEICQNP
jgi:response regulator RpfG family c-di-GMP phosphodiesterase